MTHGSTRAPRAARTSATQDFPYVLGRGVVEGIERLSPGFLRIVLGGAELRGLGTPGRTFDQRIKLIFPGDAGTVPDLAAHGAEWYQHWLSIPESERGAMRTYSIRDLRVDGERTSLVVDFVLHLVPGATGPASNWAASAAVGDEIAVFGPRRGSEVGSGIEFAPGTAGTLLLAGDETAAPAIARILEDLGDGPRQPGRGGAAFIEVPSADDRLDISPPAGFDVHWLPRDGGAHGTALIPSVLRHLGARPDRELDAGELEIVDVSGDEPVWETPQFSRLGEQTAVGENHAESYFWIAGESGVVTTLRRHLVRDLGIDRSQVAFMGYWRRGVAMRG